MNKGKRKPRKHKIKKLTLSKHYRDTESEISASLQLHNPQNLQIISNCELNEIPIETQIDFFTNLSIIEENLGGKHPDLNDSSIEERYTDDAAILNQPSPIRESEAATELYQNHSAASYIQIENVSCLIQPFAKVQIHFNDDECLYVPTEEKIANVENDEERQQNWQDGRTNSTELFITRTPSTTNSNMIKMVNRFNEEGKIWAIAAPDLLKNQKTFQRNPFNLYKTDTDIHNKTFEPIFYSLPILFIGAGNLITSKKVISITVKELLFIEHPLQTEEHRLANKLEDLYDSYLLKMKHNLIPKINFELTNIRNIIKNLLKMAIEEDCDKLEAYMKQTKLLRQKLHREELTIKNLLRNSVETWILLKSCRKRQNFNYTDFRLIIKIENVDPIEDEESWNQRFNEELSEVLREEFEKYYLEKKNRKINRNTTALRSLRKPNLEAIKLEVLEILRSCTRQPGEPKIKLCHSRLMDRCKNLEKFKDYSFSILFDNELVGTMKYFKLTSNFKIDVNQTFGVYLERKIPQNIQIKIYEKSKLKPLQKITTINVPFDVRIDYKRGHFESIEFSSAPSENITGKLNVMIYSDTKLYSSSSDLLPPNIKNKPQISMDILKNWYDNQLINPLNPYYLALNHNNNNNMLQLKHNDVEDESNFDTQNTKLIEETSVITNSTSFNFNEDSILAFCSKDEIINNQRLKMLHARFNQEIQSKDHKLIPVFENEFEEITEEKNLIEGDWMEPIDLHKYKGKKYLKKLYDAIINHFIQINRDEDASNLLIGNDPPTFRSIINRIIGFFGPARPLNPMKTHQILQPLKGVQHFNIVVNVARATGVPIRNFVHQNIDRRNSSTSILTGKNTKYGNVRPFVSITYKDKSARTMTADGSNPTYNEQLVLEISGDTTDLKDDVKFQIYDEYIEDLLNDDTSRSMEIYQRIHTNWLGEYRIPISTIFKRQRIEGAFEINIPKILIGYTKPSIDPSDGTIPVENIPEIRKTVYLWLYISMEPKFDLPKLRTSGLECSELKEVKMHIQEWCLLVKEIQSKRFLDPLASLATGKRVCLTRLLESIPLPIAGDEDNLENLIRRYVSLIPIIKTSNACLGFEGVWLNNQIILDTSWASPKDLGVLLACFYLHLGIRCWIALGISLPYGESAFVLKLENSDYIFVDPCTGKKYNNKDVNCPLISVQYIIGQENIYCNLQRENHVSMINLNLNDSSLWLALFGKKNPAPIGGVHQLDYNYIISHNTNELRKSIERKIMKKINSWRSMRKTIWNRGFADVLYQILKDLEQDTISECNNNNIYIEKLTQNFPNYKCFGFTLNFTYTNLSSISERIKQTGIHLNTDRNVEFSVAVYLHPYPNHIISCWIFITSLIPF